MIFFYKVGSLGKNIWVFLAWHQRKKKKESVSEPLIVLDNDFPPQIGCHIFHLISDCGYKSLLQRAN